MSQRGLDDYNTGHYGFYYGKYPATVKSYDQERRTCRIEIPFLTDGIDHYPEASIEYSLGDKQRAGYWETEIEIIPEDKVYIMFEGGDPRYPIITGYRHPRVGNSMSPDSGWRRWHHPNIELIADDELRLVCGTEGKSSTIRMTPTDLYIDSHVPLGNVYINLPDPKRPSFLPPIYAWKIEVDSFTEWVSGQIWRLVGCVKRCVKGFG